MNAPRPSFEIRSRMIRADARRNHARVFEAAKACFAERDANAGMEEIARRAGVGVGTLYRAFGSRAGLAEALYRDMVDELATAASDLTKSFAPWDALAKWVDTYVGQMIAKHSILGELLPLFDQDPELKDSSIRAASDALHSVLSEAQRAGVARSDLRAPDLLKLLNAAVASGPDDRSRINTMLDIILSGIQIREVANHT